MGWRERKMQANRAWFGGRLEDETDVELKKDKEEMKRETVRWMDS